MKKPWLPNRMIPEVCGSSSVGAVAWEEDGEWSSRVLELKSNGLVLGSMFTHLRFTQVCFFLLGPPNLGLSRQLLQVPQSSAWQGPHTLHRTLLFLAPADTADTAAGEAEPGEAADTCSCFPLRPLLALPRP